MRLGDGRTGLGAADNDGDGSGASGEEEQRMLTIKEAAKKILRSEVRVRQLVAQGRILGARKHGPVWAIPAPVVVLPPKPRLHHCVWRSCRHNVDIGSGRRRCAAGRSGFWGTACPQYEARADVPEWARPAWARTEAAKRD